MDKRYQRHNQKPYVKEEQSKQWSKDSKGITRSHISKKDSQYNGQKIPKASPEAVYQRRTVNTMAKRCQRYNQKPYIKGQSIQWPKDTKGIPISGISKKESIQWSKDTKGITRSHISKKDSQ